MPIVVGLVFVLLLLLLLLLTFDSAWLAPTVLINLPFAMFGGLPSPTARTPIVLPIVCSWVGERRARRTA
jgi:Cu/Ag efflux pump CusA